MFTLSTFLACSFIRFLREGLLSIEEIDGYDAETVSYLVKATTQLVAFASGEEISRHLTWRLGSRIDLYIVIMAAAPLDYFLLKTVPAWDMVGLMPCHRKMHTPGTGGACAELETHVCHRYSTETYTPDHVDFRLMKQCYDRFNISAKQARQHSLFCHRPHHDLLIQYTYAVCASQAVDGDFREEHWSIANPLGVLWRCANRFGLVEWVLQGLKGDERYEVYEGPCNGADESGRETYCVKPNKDFVDASGEQKQA